MPIVTRLRSYRSYHGFGKGGLNQTIVIILYFFGFEACLKIMNTMKFTLGPFLMLAIHVIATQAVPVNLFATEGPLPVPEPIAIPEIVPDRAVEGLILLKCDLNGDCEVSRSIITLCAKSNA